MSPLKRHFSSRNHQRGAIGLIAAGTLSMALLCMLVVLDSGRLYLEKRSLQRVADVSALEVASRKGTCAAGTAIAYATQSAARNGFTIGDDGRTLTTTCGKLTVGADSRRVFGADPTQSSAIQVAVTHSVPRSIAAGIGAMFDSTPQPLNIQLSAVAVATPPLPPLAQLTIQTNLATIDSTQSPLLNALWGGFLGGTLNISAVGYQGLVNANISLLKFLDQLAIDIGVKAGDYTSLLGTNISLTQLLTTTAKVLPQGSGTAQIAINQLSAIVGSTQIKLQDLLNVQTGVPAAGLNLGLNAFNLIQGMVQVANSNNALSATIPANLLGLLKVTATVKVIQPPQLSAVGDPSLATPNDTDPNQIVVRTAQIRTHINVDLGVVSSLLGALNLILGALPIVNLQVATNLDVGLDVASASSHVTGFTCDSDATKSLKAVTKTAAAVIAVGKIDTSTTPMTVSELPVIDIGTCPSIFTCTPRTSYGGGGLGVLINNTPVAGAMDTYTFIAPAEIGIPPNKPYHTLSSTNIVGSLSTTLNNVTVTVHSPVNGGLLGLVLGAVNTLVAGLKDLLANTISGLLSPILDPIVNSLLNLLGINIAQVQVGANLSCHPGQAALVI